MKTLLTYLTVWWACMVLAPAARAEGAAPAAGYTRTEDVVYGRKDGMALTLDVFQPAGKANGFGVIYIVSSGWHSTHTRILPDTYRPYLERGYTVFAVLHGSEPRFFIPEIVPDIHRAVRYIRHHAARWGIDPNRLGLSGGSAGGHLSLMIGTQSGQAAPEQPDEVDRESSAVQAIGCFFPPTDFLNYGADGADGVGVGLLWKHQAAFGPESETPEGRRRLGERISPARHITAQLPPTLIIHGDADDLVPIQQSRLFVERAAAVGAKAVLLTRPGGHHGWDGWPGVDADRGRIADWFDVHLRGLRREVPQ